MLSVFLIIKQYAGELLQRSVLLSNLDHLEGYMPFYLQIFWPLLSHVQYRLKGVEKWDLRGLYKVKMSCLLYHCFF